MGVIQQLGEYSGNPYSFKIAGDTPTVEEVGRISQILSQQELPYQQRYEAQYGGIRSVASDPEDTDRTAVGRGFVREPSQKQYGFGVAEQYLADTAIGRALGLDPKAGIERQRLAEEELARLEAEDPSIGFRDITGLDTAASFAGEQLGSEARDTAIQLGATATGAGIGALFGGFGAAPGAAIGRGVGVGYTTVQALPQMFAEAIDKQKEAGGDINLTKALGATAANALSEFIVDYFVVGKFMPPGVDAGALKRAVVEGGKSAGVEGAFEVSQSVVNRAQAGLDLTSEDALLEYAEALAAGSVVGGTLGGTGAVLAGRGESEGSKELNKDLLESASETRDRLGYADTISKELTSEVEKQNDEAVAGLSETPQVKQQAEGMGISEVTTDEEFESNTFDKAQYDRVMQQIKADMAREKSLSVTGIHQQVKKDLPGTKVSQVRDIMAEMESRGYLESDPKRGWAAAKYQPTKNMVPQLKTPDVSYRRQIDIANEAVEKNNQIIAGLKLDLDSVREYGRDLQGKRTSENAIQYEMDRLNKRNAQYGKLVNGAQQGLQRLGTLPYVPKVTPETGKAQSLEAKVAAAKARSVADQVKEKVQSNNPVFTPALNEKQANVFKSIRKRLDGYGLKDVRLNAEQVVDAGEGTYNPFGRVISLSMGVYDPNLSEAELFNRVGEVLDHETTHALKEMNVITPSEWSSLTNAAGKVKYAKTKDGQAQKRKYSYLDRAKRMYSKDTAEVQAEEAVAEMFRDYNAGRLKLAGKPKGLFNKIKNFFKSIVGGSVDNGFTDVQSIFDNINVGEIGGRDRGQAIAQDTQPAVRSSRLAATEEEVRPLEEIRMPIDSTAPNDQIRAQIQRMTNQNRPIVRRMVKRIDERFGTKSGDNAKDLSKVTQKANRPSIKAKKPWHDVSHIRDSYRFKTVIPDFRDVPAIFDELLAEGIGLVKIDTNKLFQPGEWGWRIIAFDLRMPNGQLVEWYLPLKELEAEKKARGHLIFEEWRNKTQEEMNANQVEFMKALDTSWTNYNDAFLTSLDRMGLSPQEAEASWRNAETSISDAALNSRRSSGMMVSSRDSLGTQVPSSDLNIGSEPSLKRTARSVPSSINARAAMLSTSDDYVTGVPVENQVKFSRLPRTSSVSGLQSFIRNNPDGFTIDPVTMEPVTSGFVVAPLKEAEIIVGETLPEEVLLGYIDDNKDIARATNKSVYLGGWFDEDSQQYFLDNTLIVPTAEEALYIAEAADQLAIFNLNNFEEIRTNEGIRQLQANGTYRGDTAVGYQRNLAEVGRRFAEARNNRNSRQKEQLAGRIETPKPYISDQSVRDTSPDQSFFDAVNKIPNKKMFSRLPSPDGPLLSDENNTGVQRFTVFRLGDDQDLRNKNGADINGIYMFTDMMDEKGMGYGDRLTQYTVEVDGEFSKYRALRNSKPPEIYDPTESVGVEGYGDDSAKGYRWYSFMANGENKTWRIVGQPKVYSFKELLRNADAWTKERGGEYAQQDYGTFGAAMANQLYPDTQYAQEVERWLARDYSPKRWEFDNDLGTAVVKDGVRQSRLTLPLTPEQRAASVLDYLDPDTGRPKFKSKPGSETLVSFANKLLELRGTRSYDLNSPDDREEVARIMAAEAEAALLSSSDALGWYDSTLKLAKQILFPVYPEVSPLRPDGTENALYDPASEHAFDFATAITSNGLSVIDNYLLASRQYDAWKNSTDGRFPLAASGKQGQSMMKAWEFWNHLTDFGYDSNQINDLLMTQLPKGELAGLMTEVFGVERVKDLPFKIDGKELASETVGVAYVLGPKIGNGFYQNLRGNFSPLTMDRWWMRFVNRITGNPIVDYNDELVQANKDKLWSMISNPDSLSDTDKKLLVDTLESLGISTVEKSDIELIAPQVQKVWDKNFYNKAFNDKLDSLSDQYDFVITKDGTITGKDAAKVKKLAQDARPNSTDLALAAKNLSNKLSPELQEDPRNARERASMRATAVRAREILRNSNQLALDITNADFQALMWYAEKRIFEAGGVRKGRGDDNDYADGAIAILEKKGVSDDEIKATLPDSERGRLSSVKSQLKRDAEIGREIDQIQRGPIEGNFFAPRELTILDSSMAAQEQLTQQELSETNADMSGLEVDPELPPQRFSRMITADALVPVRAPVNLKDGSSNPVYGYFMDRGRLRPIVLPKGSHRTYESGVEVGQGLFHIQQRNHDRELVENSKYKRVENAIYDMLRRWQDQGYDDGPAVISYPSQNGIVLEWRNNIAFSAPPMRLVLESGRDLPNAPAKDVFYIKTFFPILEKKARKTSPVVRKSIMYSTLSEDVQEKQYNLNYAKAADFLGKGLGFVLPKDKAQDAADAVIRKFQDDMLPVGRMIQELKKAGAKITDAFDAYLQEELYHGRVGAEVDTRQKTIYKDAVDAVKVLNVPASKVNELKTLSSFFSKVLENYPSKKLAIADAVLYATHAKERNAFIRKRDPKNNSGSGMTDGEADAILAWVATLDAPSISALQGIQSSVRAIIKDTNDSRANYGLTPEELREDKNFNSYVPLQGKDDPTDGEVGSGARLGAKGFGVRGREDRRALGRFDYATDILATAFNQNQNTVVRGERNRVGQAFIKLLQAEPEKTRGFGRILDRLPTMRVLDTSGKVREVRDPSAAQNENIFVAKVDGKDVYVELNDARIARALKGSDGTGSSSLASITRALGKMNRYLSSINTSYNPEFLITNIIRDIQTAGVNVQQFDAKGMVKSMAKDYTKAFAGIKRAIRDGDKDSEWAKIYADFVRDGGQNSANPMNSVADQIANIENVLGDIAEDGARGKFNKMKNSFAGEKVGSLFKFLEDYNTVAENAIRVAVYKGLKDKGFTNERAAQAARNVTVNFGKGGENKTAMNSFYLFYNASIQGSFALFNGLLRSPKVRKIWGGLIAYGLMQDFINSLISEEDDDGVLVYDKIRQDILEHNLVLATGGLTDRGYIAIPMPYGLNSAVNAGRALGRTLRGEYSASEGATSAIMTLVDSLNPLGGTENILNFGAPTALDPFVEILRNKNFAGIPIYKEQYPGGQSPDSQRYFNSVSPSSKWIAENLNSLTGGTDQMSGFIDWNPEIMDYWFDYLTGGIGRFVQRAAVDVPISAYNDGLTEDLVSEIPFIRKIIGSVSEREDIGIFVEKRDRVLRVGQEIKKAQDTGDRDRFMRAREKYSDEIALLPRVKAINNAIRKVSKQQNAVRDNVNIPDSQRKLILERLDEQKQMLYARGNMMMKDYR